MFLEKELKYSLLKEDFYKLIDYLKLSGRFICKEVNKNYYIDSDKNDLNEYGVSMRLRNISDKQYEFTTKLKKKTKHLGLNVREEYNKQLSKEIFEKIINESIINVQSSLFDDFKNIRKLLIDKEIFLLFINLDMLQTERYKFMISNSIEFSMDISKYYGVVDYELEVELHNQDIDKSIEIVEELLRKLFIKVQTSVSSKSQRFALESQKQKIKCR